MSDTATAAYPEANLLGNETSPYLLQHRDNPVHWRPWGEAALAEARATGKPILLSVGYAACHWCHVMAHESFEDPETARLMNALFVNIKVDREERPDLDAIYQTALALMGEQGGWPLTMFLTPEGEPFWGGTYFPPEQRYGRPSFRDVLRGIAEAYRTRPDDVKKNTQALVGALRNRTPATTQAVITADLLDRIAERLMQEVDPVHGGIGGALKFPQPSIFELIWRAYRRTGAVDMKRAVTLTLDRMCQGGIYDHLGGGFARYSTDARWLVPHFEKMLYDNAQMIELLALVWQETKSPLYAARVAETIDWLKREMISEGEEGKFYVWTAGEIDAALGDNATIFKDAYDVTPEGNWEGHTILNRSKRMLLGSAEHEAKLAACRRILFDLRAKRVPPGRDDKVLADWNGLMIAALARCGFIFAQPEWIVLAETALAGIRRLMTGADGRLGHSYRGRLRHRATLDDYANLARAATLLFEVTGNTGHLAYAEQLVAAANAWYWDKTGGGYFFTAEDATDLIARTKHAHDNATPSGNGVMAQVLTRLYHHTGKPEYRDRAAAVIATFSGEVQRNFFPLSTLLNAAELAERPLQVVLAGPPDPIETLRQAVATTASLPNLILQQVGADAALPQGHPARGKGMIDGRPTAYICEGPVCSAPVTDPAELASALTSR
jgi:uncharacterized protein YyaL (SSP411 family)